MSASICQHVENVEWDGPNGILGEFTLASQKKYVCYLSYPLNNTMTYFKQSINSIYIIFIMRFILRHTIPVKFDTPNNPAYKVPELYSKILSRNATLFFPFSSRILHTRQLSIT